MCAFNYTLLLLFTVLSVSFARSTAGRDCSKIPLAPETQLTVAVTDPETNEIIQTPNGYLIAKNYKIKDVWFAAYYASSAALPDILQQYGVAEGSTRAIKKFSERGAPLFANIIMDVIRHTGASNNTYASSEHNVDLQSRHILHRRDIIDDISGWFKDTFGSVSCGPFASVGLGSFTAAAAAFDSSNGGGIGLTDDQMFFVRAAAGYAPPGIVIHYDANFAPGFEDAQGATFLRDIYMRAKGNTVDTRPAADLENVDKLFAETTYIVVHEVWHVRQYESHGFSLAMFAHDYLYNYCKAGLSYAKNKLEVDANRISDSIMPFLFSENVIFFKIWRLMNLKPILGYPLSTMISTSNWGPTAEKISALNFQGGILEIRIRSRCYRIWARSDLQARRAALCNPNTPNRKGTSYNRNQPCGTLF
ncbi:hypothetical protein BGX27_008366 [Mortierella sp. AM989]|nr:hypothetical protein BGX27_008366 [Mortierella sp. AM989]